MHLLRWPKTRRLTDHRDFEWEVKVEPGRLTLTFPPCEPLVFSDVDELRAFAMQVHAAAIDHDLAVQAAAAKASADRRLARQRRGEPTGVRHGPFTDAPEPPMHMEVPA
jgi:hypothetical protein